MWYESIETGRVFWFESFTEVLIVGRRKILPKIPHLPRARKMEPRVSSACVMNLIYFRGVDVYVGMSRKSNTSMAVAVAVAVVVR